MTTQSEQQLATFLSGVLSQRGPTSLPYSEEIKWLIRQHIVALVNSFPSLDAKTALFTHNDGRAVTLLQIDGTIPMLFNSVTYNIPVLFWLIDSYPRHPPLVYVNPTRDMIIKRGHPFVDPNGLVISTRLPYLNAWVFPSSNLLDLARSLSTHFAQNPPLFSQPRPNPNPNPSNYADSGYSSYARPVIPARSSSNYPPSPYGSSSSSFTASRPMEDAAEVYKRNAVNKIVEMVHLDMEGVRKAREAEMDLMFLAQVALRQRSAELARGMKEMNDEKEGLEQQLQMVLMNSDVVEAWLRENQGKGTGGNGDVDDAFECMDALSKQMLECTAADLAIEDVVYSLDKAVQDGGVPFEQYLRTVRLLSREQFFHRATAAKVRAVQMQSQVANMAARLTHYIG